ncbi:MAG TPA: FAD-dependent oxidoreductase [Lachnospiraceae bacterium]
MGAQSNSNLYDVVIVGGGPAGLTAALYLARARYRVVVVEMEKFGGQITITSEVVNYPGVEKTDGHSLTESMRKQAENFGAEFMLATVESLDMDGDIKRVKTDRATLECFGVLLATGAHPRKIGFIGEEEYKGRGVAYCATCDGEFFTGKDVYVIGAGFAAAEESVFLTKYANRVTILMRDPDFTCAPAVAESARNHEKIDLVANVEVLEVSGSNGLNYLRYRNIHTGEETEIRAKDGERFGVFSFAGYVPATGLVKGIADLDPMGYVLTDKEQMTSKEGLYAAGDVCVKALRQVVTAVGDGALAATELEKYAQKMQKKTGLQPKQPQVYKKEEVKTEKIAAVNGDSFFDAAILEQLQPVFDRMATPLVLKVFLDERAVSGELKNYMEELAKLTDKLLYQEANQEELSKLSKEELPFVRIERENGQDTGLAFHGVPGGHEFTSFVLGLYNAAGPGQAIEEQLQEKIAGIKEEINIKIMVSLTCTMCPELVVSAQRIAAENPHIRAEIYDLNHFPGLKDKYQVMSVPCMVINDREPMFGKKNIKQLLEILE